MSGKPRKSFKSKKRGCDGKQAFDTLEAADKAAQRPWKQLSQIGFMKGYACTRCKRFHYGHPPK